MTTTTWQTTGDVPAGPWATLVADMQRLLQLTVAGGATVTGPAGTGQPVLSTERIGFVVTTPGGAPLSVTFTRKADPAGTATTVVTNAASTDGLVLVALQRAARAWGQLLTWTTDAGTVSHAVASGILAAVFDPDDRAIDGTPTPSPINRLATVVTRVQLNAGTGQQTTEIGLLKALILELGSELAGLQIAQAMTPAAPTPVDPAGASS